MKKFLTIVGAMVFTVAGAQDTLPNFTVENISNNIIVSWKNQYTKTVQHIKIQRSYDSLRHYTTIGSVLNPGNTENGYSDNRAPYKKMYYRIFIQFSDGSYVITTPRRPIKRVVAAEPEDSAGATLRRFPWQAEPITDQPTTDPGGIRLPGPEAITYPSKRIYTAKNQLVVIRLPDAMIKNYSAVFFDDKGKKIFELKKLKEDFLMLEKFYFLRSGWFNFELFESGKLIEKNKLYIPPDKLKADRNSGTR